MKMHEEAAFAQKSGCFFFFWRTGMTFSPRFVRLLRDISICKKKSVLVKYGVIMLNTKISDVIMHPDS